MAEDAKNGKQPPRRQRLLDSARELFFSKGYEKTTMLEVARLAGFSKRTVYLDFESKDDLFGAICEEGLRILQRSFENAISISTSEEEELILLAKSYHSFFVEEKRYFHSLFIMANDEILQKMSPEQFDRIHDLEKSCIDLIAQSIRRAKATNVIHENQEPNELAVIVWGALNGVVSLSLNGRRVEMTDKSIDELYWNAFQLILNGARHTE
jgi:AcrR family transcriptional regulator